MIEIIALFTMSAAIFTGVRAWGSDDDQAVFGGLHELPLGLGFILMAFHAAL